MKLILKVVLLAGPLLALPTQAQAWWGICGSSCGGPCGWNLWPFGGCLAGPWYSYWPYEAHFMAGAPPFGCSYPYWPAQGGAVAYPGGMGDFYSQAGSMGYPANAGFSYSQAPTWPTNAGFSYSQAPTWPASPAAPTSFPLTGSPPVQGLNYWPGH